MLHLGTWAVGGSIVGSSTACKICEEITLWLIFIWSVILDDTVYQLQDSCSSIVVTTEQMLEMMIEAVKECPSVTVRNHRRNMITSFIQTIICLRSSENRLSEGIFDYKDTLKHDPIQSVTQGLDVRFNRNHVVLQWQWTRCVSSFTHLEQQANPRESSTLIALFTADSSSFEGIRFSRALLSNRRFSHWLHEIYPVLGGREVQWFTVCVRPFLWIIRLIEGASDRNDFVSAWLWIHSTQSLSRHFFARSYNAFLRWWRIFECRGKVQGYSNIISIS